ncbi:MAG: hypothetical protein WCA99_09940, partial [Candidatus Sulfotelmatobacter sp.]
MLESIWNAAKVYVGTDALGCPFGRSSTTRPDLTPETAGIPWKSGASAARPERSRMGRVADE